MAGITYRKAISRVLKETLDNDPRAFMMGEDIGTYEGAYAVTRGFLDKSARSGSRTPPYPNR